MRPNQTRTMRFWKTPHIAATTDYLNRSLSYHKAERTRKRRAEAIAETQAQQQPATAALPVTERQPQQHKRNATMGQINDTKAVYVKVSNGKFCVKCDQADANYFIDDKDGKRSYYNATNGFTGTIHNITIDAGKFGKQYTFHIIDEKGAEYKIVMRYGASMAEGLLNSLASVAHTLKEIPWLKFSASAKTKGDRTYTSIYLSNGGSESFRWKHDLKDIPPVVIEQRRSGEFRNDEARLEFFDNLLENDIRPALKPLTVSGAKLGVEGEKPHTALPDDDEDIPF
jgi:hypothetical protein